MNPLDRIVSLVRPGDTVEIRIERAEKGQGVARLIVIPRLKGVTPDSESDAVTATLIANLTQPLLITLDEGELASVELDKHLDALSGAQQAALSALDERLSRLQASAAKAKEVPAKDGKNAAPTKPTGKTPRAPAKVTVTASDATGDSAGAEHDAAPNASAPAPAASPAEPAAKSVFDD